MQIINILTDFGTADHRVAALKNHILKLNGSVQCIDVTHEIPVFDISQAAFMIRNIIPHATEKAIHLVWVCNYAEEHGILMAEYQNQFIIAPDNGLISLIAEDLSVSKVYRLSEDFYNYQECVALAIQSLIQSEYSTAAFTETDQWNKKFALQAVYQKDQVKASAIFIDRYGNIVLNVQRDAFERVCQNRSFTIVFSRNDHIDGFLYDRELAQAGELFSYFSASGYLTIAICAGNAAHDLEIKKEDHFQIVFQ